MSEAADEKLERMIVRYIDGEMDESERAELQRRFVDNPAAGEMLEQYARADRLAGEALRSVLAGGGDSIRPAAWTARRDGATAAGMPLAGKVAAAAAVVLIAAGAWLLGRHALRPTAPAGGGTPIVPVAATPRPAELVEVEAAAIDTVEPLPAVPGPRRDESFIDRHYLGLFDEAENKLYIMEMRRRHRNVRAVSADL